MTSTRSSWFWMIEAAAWRAREIVKRDSLEGWISGEEGLVRCTGNNDESLVCTVFDESGLCERVVAVHPAVVDVEQLLICG